MILEMLEALSRFLSIPVGQLGTDNSTAMELAPSGSGIRDLTGTTDGALSLLILSKHTDQAACIQALDTAARRLTQTRTLPAGDCWQMYAADTSTQTNYIAKDGDYWIYSCIISVRFISKEGFINA